MLKKIGVVIAGMLLFMGQTLAFASDSFTVTSSLLGKTNIETTYMDAFGVSLTSVRDSSTTVQTIRRETGKSDIRSVTTTRQSAISSWRGSGLKIDGVTGTSQHLQDGQTTPMNNETFSTDYKNAYDEKGTLAFADRIIGTSDSIGRDDGGDESVSHTTNRYEIHGAEAFTIGSSTHSDTFFEGDHNKKISSTDITGTTLYAEMGGAWVNTSSTSHSVTVGSGQKTDTNSDTTRTTTYNRDSNGLLTGLNVGMTGTRVIEEQGGHVSQYIYNGPVDGDHPVTTTFTLAHDDQQGYYIGQQTIVWTI